MQLEKTADKRWKCELDMADIEVFRDILEGSGYVKNRYQGNRVVRYLLSYKDAAVEVRSMPSKAVLFSTSSISLKALLEELFRLDIDRKE